MAALLSVFPALRTLIVDQLRTESVSCEKRRDSTMRATLACEEFGLSFVSPWSWFCSGRPLSPLKNYPARKTAAAHRTFVGRLPPAARSLLFYVRIGAGI